MKERRLSQRGPLAYRASRAWDSLAGARTRSTRVAGPLFTVREKTVSICAPSINARPATPLTVIGIVVC
jgi:hypothetical protein